MLSQLVKQDLIFSFTCLKKHNSEVNWNKREVVIIQCYIYCSSCQDICKAKKQQIYTFNACVSGPFSALADESENATQYLWTSNKYQKELGNYFYIT